MKSELITIFLGFLEGFALILSPCILSILPIILASALAGSKRRPLGIILGFALTFSLFAFFSRQLLSYSGINFNLIRPMAYGLLFLIALIMLSNQLTEKFNQIFHKMAMIGSYFASHRGFQSGFLSGFYLGSLVALIWTPCAGPILATIILQTVIQKTTLSTFFTLLAFALGAAIPMFIIAIYGLKLRDASQFFKTNASLFRKALGVIIIINVVYMVYQERGLVSSSIAEKSGIKTANYLEQGVWNPYLAPKIGGIAAWINSAPLELSNLKDKVVLIDFWTYSCINCIRTLPYLKSWYNQYHDKGLVIIGIHTPEFDFEKNLDNVKNAVKRNGIQYPVALDNLFVTWQNFSNRYWPAHYLINKNGLVVYEHLGEGDYDVTENNIRFLLGIDMISTPMPPEPSNASFLNAITPETYLGYARANSALSPNLQRDQVADYQFPSRLYSDAWALRGAWQINADKIISSQPNTSLKIHFHARKVYMVMGRKTKMPIEVKVLLDGTPLIEGKAKDVINGQLVVDKHTLYELVDFPESRDGILEISPDKSGLEVFTFTFGN